MTRLTILHETRYGYERPVSFGPHRLLIRPRDSHATRLVEASVSLSPAGETRWVYDALGNCVCWYRPQGEARELTVTSRLTLERYPALLAPFTPDDPKTRLPIVYDLSDRLVLEPFITPATEDPDAVLLKWLRGLIGRPDEAALDFILRLNGAIHDGFDYSERREEGVLAPAETLKAGAGTCRDFAWLMVEGLRLLGYGARFVTGYLHDPQGAARGAGATHAWCEAFLPDLGWTQFDPTNGLAESADLIPVAVSRTPREAAPVSGLVIGDPGHCELQVRVEVAVDGSFQAAA